MYCLLSLYLSFCTILSKEMGFFLSMFLNMYARHRFTTFTQNVYNNLFNWLTEHRCLGIHPNLTGYIISIVGWLKRLYKTGWYIYTSHIVVPVPNQDVDVLRYLSCSIVWCKKWLIVLLILVEFVNCLDFIPDWGKWNSNIIW